MRLLIAGLAVAPMMALTMVSAQAQLGPQASQMQGASAIGQSAGRATQQSDTDTQKVKANEKAYNSALKNLPDKQYDPWHGVR
jgi:hypothetical protein